MFSECVPISEVRVAQMNLPLPMYDVEFIEETHWPLVFGRPLQQRVWSIIGKVSETHTSRTMLKRIGKRLEHYMDNTKFYDPYWKKKTAALKLFSVGDRAHIVLDNFMSRKLRHFATLLLTVVLRCLLRICCVSEEANKN